MKYINIDKLCKDCNYKCEKKEKDISICIQRRQVIEDTDTQLTTIKDMLKFEILWFLDNDKCTMALTQSKDLSQCVDKIIDNLTDIENLPIILASYRAKQIFENNKKD